ncbi:MAG: substrate-binding domain-containing protein, partial [Planctomycetota bacterium]|nr:substrate-binding domain-containing protein [Planctomycetota bacterium]
MPIRSWPIRRRPRRRWPPDSGQATSSSAPVPTARDSCPASGYTTAWSFIPSPRFSKARGYKPTAVAVAIDCVAVYVNKDNPVEGLSLPQIDAVFSSTRKLNHEDVATWGQLGLTGEWANRNISMYGRNAASGTYAFFKEVSMGNG